jgi:prealbumin domain-containing protein
MFIADDRASLGLLDRRRVHAQRRDGEHRGLHERAGGQLYGHGGRRTRQLQVREPHGYGRWEPRRHKPIPANITIKPGDQVTCTYVNKASGAILVTKTAENHNLGAGQHPLAGATFTVNGMSKVTNANGQACFDGLTIGTTYTVTETAAPTGYCIDTATKDVTVTKAASCTSGTPDGVSFTDSPLKDISANATSEIAGATNSTIVCKDANGNTVADSGAASDPANASATALRPGTYTCTVVIDP